MTKSNQEYESSQLNIGAIAKVWSVSRGGVGDVVGTRATSCGSGELSTELKAAASGLKDVLRCRSTGIGRSMVTLLLRSR